MSVKCCCKFSAVVSVYVSDQHRLILDAVLSAELQTQQKCPQVSNRLVVWYQLYVWFVFAAVHVSWLHAREAENHGYLLLTRTVVDVIYDF